MAHLGRPTGADFAERAAGGPSLQVVGVRLAELLGKPVEFAADLVGPSAAATVAGLTDGDVALLENVRFEPAETSKDDSERARLAARLAALGDVYVGDGFGVVHRKQASVYDLPALLPHAAGDLVLAEVAVLKRLTDKPERPYVVVLGGSKVSDKLGVIGNLLGLADRLVIGGGMAYTFLAAQGHEVGTSLLEADQIDSVAGAGRRATARGRDRAADRHRRGDGVRRRRGLGRRRPTRSRPTGWAWTSGRTRARCSPPSWSTPRRCSGTGRWASSSSRRSPRAPARWPRH